MCVCVCVCVCVHVCVCAYVCVCVWHVCYFLFAVFVCMQVLGDLPEKSDLLLFCGMTQLQREQYKALLMKDTSEIPVSWWSPLPYLPIFTHLPISPTSLSLPTSPSPPPLYLCPPPHLPHLSILLYLPTSLSPPTSPTSYLPPPHLPHLPTSPTSPPPPRPHLLPAPLHCAGAFSGSGSRTSLMNILMNLRKCANHPYLFNG